MSSVKVLATGLGGAIGSDFRSALNQLVFVEYNGKLSRLNLFRTATVVNQGSTVLKGTFNFDLDTGVQGGGAGADIWWEQQTNVARQMTPQGTARILNLGAVDFNALTADGLQMLAYAATPINGSNNASNKLVPGDVFAVITNQGNYAKVKVVAYGYDLSIQWCTYYLDPAYAVLGTGYNQPEDVKASADGVHLYVTERVGNLLRVTAPNYNRASAAVVTASLNTPQQMFLDEAHNTAYVVEYASPGHLWKIDLTTGTKTAIVSNLENAVGVVLSADLQYAYVSEQTAGADKGRVSRIQISNAATQKLATGLTAPFFLRWADATQTTLLCPERDPANQIRSISVGAVPGTSVAVSGVPSKPSSVAVVTPGVMLICSDQVIEQVDFSQAFQPAGPLLMGIGFIPFDKVKQPSGIADTTVDPTYFYQVKDTPFGGTLPLMVNYQRAFNDGAVYYRVKVDGVVRMDSWTDEKWNGVKYVAQTTVPLTVAGSPGYYPVHPVSELFLWMNPSLGMLMDSTNLTNSTHQLTIEFTNAAGAVLETTAPLWILVNNQSCWATLAPPMLNGVAADATCGVLKYGANTASPVVMAFTAGHPANFANFSFSVIKGVNGITIPGTTSGPVTAAVSPLSDTVAHLLGTCTIAGFAEHLYVAATMNNGWGRQGQYDASAAVAFALAP